MVKWTKPARLDLKQIYDYIARDSKFYAKKISQEMVEKSEKLNSAIISCSTPVYNQSVL